MIHWSAPMDVFKRCQHSHIHQRDNRHNHTKVDDSLFLGLFEGQGFNNVDTIAS